MTLREGGVAGWAPVRLGEENEPGLGEGDLDE